ncbi:MAG: hypothetical protein CVV27_09575 [Candidatus Melainabacteria bacterium HGW-Melainabacteria-1]|nr:MAG: hypothetical protein CVV27_09575 [Candidatus Melainabacteria bacterium HGW-Melainabacteria-1]
MRRRLMILALALMPLSSTLGGLLYLFWWLSLLGKPPSRLLPPDAAASNQAGPFAQSPQKRPYFALALLLFCLLGLLTVWVCAQPSWHLAGWLSRHLLPGLLIWGCYWALRTGRLGSAELLTGMLCGSLLLAGVGLVNYVFDWAPRIQALCFTPYGGFCLIDFHALAEDRARGFSMHPNVLGSLMAMALPLWIYRLGSARGLGKLPALAGLLTISIALLLSFSRAAWLAGALSGLIGCFWLLNASWRQGIFLATALSLPALLLGPLASVSLRLAELLSSAGSHASRILLWQGGLAMLAAHPWLGTGLLQVEPLLPLYAPPIPGGAGHLHNWYLQIAVESGLPAALLYFALLAALLGTPRDLTPLGKACWLAWSGFLVSACFDITLLDLRVAFGLCLLLALLLQQRNLMRQLTGINKYQTAS